VIAAGDGVWTMFPFGPPDRPDEPGPVRHIAYVLATSQAGAMPMALLAYTSSGPWRGAAARLPAGVVEFDAAAARALGQRAFHLDLRCLAQVPLTARWFPDWAEPGHGVVGQAGAKLRARLEAQLTELATRNRDAIEMRGVR
jgi:hypothetical protein